MTGATIGQIANNRPAADGAAHAAAVEQLHQAYVELLAHDMALANRNLLGETSRSLPTPCCSEGQ